MDVACWVQVFECFSKEVVRIPGLIIISIVIHIYVVVLTSFPSNAYLVLRCHEFQRCNVASNLLNVDSPVRRSLSLRDDDRKDTVLETGLHSLLVDTLWERE